jgi:hypothetical protein
MAVLLKICRHENVEGCPDTFHLPPQYCTGGGFELRGFMSKVKVKLKRK